MRRDSVRWRPPFAGTARGSSSTSSPTTWGSAATAIATGSTCSQGAGESLRGLVRHRLGARPRLDGRLLLPVLGEATGLALRRGAGARSIAGGFAVWAHGSHRLPVSPRSYGGILRSGGRRVSCRSGGGAWMARRPMIPRWAALAARLARAPDARLQRRPSAAANRRLAARPADRGAGLAARQVHARPRGD